MRMRAETGAFPGERNDGFHRVFPLSPEDESLASKGQGRHTISVHVGERESAPADSRGPTMIRRSGQIFALICGLAACAGPSARGQSANGPAISPNIYEVAPEQVPSGQEAPAFIEVGGNAAVSVPADRAHVAFAMETRAGSAAEAASANATAMDRVLATLRSAELPGLELETFGYRLEPQYATDAQRVRSVVGYAAMNNVRATITDVDAVGRLIDSAVAGGANRVASIAFSASDTEGARAQAMAEAVRSARAEAEVIAQALGYGLGAPLEVRGGAQRPVPVPMAFSAEAARAVQSVPTPIEAGDQTVTANVTIRFALGPALSRP